MDGFNYNNIFETKGIEYLIIIAFLIIVIPFWIAINRQSVIKKHFKRALGIFSAAVIRIPQGLFFNVNHTWTHLEKSGKAKIGLDDFLLHLTGEVKFSILKNPGDNIRKGDLLTEIDQNGKHLRIYSPLSGLITETNPVITESPGILTEDPYGKGWIYRIKPLHWIAETSSCYFAEEAIAWAGKEVERFKDFLALSVRRHSPESSYVILQDGGELCDRPLSELPDEIWQDFQNSFLNQVR